MKIKAEPVQIEKLCEDKSIQIYNLGDFIYIMNTGLDKDVTTFRVKADEIMNVKWHHELIRCIRVVSITAYGENVVKNLNYRLGGKSLLLIIGKQLNGIDIKKFKKIDEVLIDRRLSRISIQHRGYTIDVWTNKVKCVEKKSINKYKIIIPLLITVGALFITKMVS